MTATTIPTIRNQRIPPSITYVVVAAATFGPIASVDHRGRLSLLKLAVLLTVLVAWPALLSALHPRSQTKWVQAVLLCLLVSLTNTAIHYDSRVSNEAIFVYVQGALLFAIAAGSKATHLARAWVAAALISSSAVVAEILLNYHYGVISAYEEYLRSRAIDDWYVAGFFGNPNNLASFAFLSFVGVIFIAATDDSRAWRRAATISGLANIAIILLSGSRLAFGATLVLASTVGWTSLRRRGRSPSRVIFALLALALLIGVPQFVSGESIGLAKVTRLLSGDLGGSGADLRAPLVENGLAIASDHWYLGSGVGSFELQMRERNDPRLQRYAGEQVVDSHNLLLELIVEGGLLVAFVFVRAWFASFRLFYQASGRSRPALGAGMAGLVLGSALIALAPSSILEMPVAWLFIGSLACIAEDPGIVDGDNPSRS